MVLVKKKKEVCGWKQTAPGKLEWVCWTEEYWEEVGGGGSGSGSSGGGGGGGGNNPLSDYQTKALAMLRQSSKYWALINAGWTVTGPEWIPRSDLPEGGFWRFYFRAPSGRVFTSLDDAYEYFLQMSGSGSSGSSGGVSDEMKKVVEQAGEVLAKRVEEATGERPRTEDELTAGLKKLIAAEDEAAKRAEEILRRMQEAYEENLKIFEQQRASLERQLQQESIVSLAQKAFMADVRTYSLISGIPEQVIISQKIYERFGQASYFNLFIKGLKETIKSGYGVVYVPEYGTLSLSLQKTKTYSTYSIPRYKIIEPLIDTSKPAASILFPGGLPFIQEEKTPLISPTPGTSFIGPGGLPFTPPEQWQYSIGSFQFQLEALAREITITAAEKYPFYGISEGVRKTITGESENTPVFWVRERLGNVAGGILESPPAIVGTAAQGIAFTGILVGEIITGGLSEPTKYRLELAKESVSSVAFQPEFIAEAALTAGAFYVGGKAFRFAFQDRMILKEARQITVIESITEKKPAATFDVGFTKATTFMGRLFSTEKLPMKIEMATKTSTRTSFTGVSEATGKAWFELVYEKKPSPVSSMKTQLKSIFAKETPPATASPSQPQTIVPGGAEFKVTIFEHEIPVSPKGFDLKSATTIIEGKGWVKSGGKEIPFTFKEFGKEKIGYVGEEANVVLTQRMLYGSQAFNQGNLPKMFLDNTRTLSQPTQIKIHTGYSQLLSRGKTQLGRGWLIDVAKTKAKVGETIFSVGESEIKGTPPTPTKTLTIFRPGKPVSSLEQLFSEMLPTKEATRAGKMPPGGGFKETPPKLAVSPSIPPTVGRLFIPSAGPFQPPAPSGGGFVFGGGIWAKVVGGISTKQGGATASLQKTATATKTSGGQVLLLKQKQATTQTSVNEMTKTQQASAKLKTETKVKAVEKSEVAGASGTSQKTIIVVRPKASYGASKPSVFPTKTVVGAKEKTTTKVAGPYATTKTKISQEKEKIEIQKVRLTVMPAIATPQAQKTMPIITYKANTKGKPPSPPRPPPPGISNPRRKIPDFPIFTIHPRKDEIAWVQQEKDRRHRVSGKYVPSFVSVGVGIKGSIGISEKFGFAIRPIQKKTR